MTRLKGKMKTSNGTTEVQSSSKTPIQLQAQQLQKRICSFMRREIQDNERNQSDSGQHTCDGNIPITFTGCYFEKKRVDGG